MMDRLARYRVCSHHLMQSFGGAMLGYASSFAFVKVNRRHLTVSWIAANSISMLIFAVFFHPALLLFTSLPLRWWYGGKG